MHRKTHARLVKIKKLLTETPISAIELVNELNKEPNFKTSKRNLIEDVKKLRKGALGKPLNIIFENGNYTLIGNSNWDSKDLSNEYSKGADLVLAFLKKHNSPFSKLVLQLLKEEHGIDDSLIKGLEIKNGFAFPEEIVSGRINTIFYCFRHNKILKFNYNRVNNERTFEDSKQIKILPLKLVMWNNRVYVFGIPEGEKLELDSVKNYAIDRFAAQSEICDPTKKFSWSNLFDELEMEDYLKDCIGVWRPKNKKPVFIKRWFKDWAVASIKATPLHPTQMIINRKKRDTQIQVRWKVYDTIELAHELAKYREYVSAAEFL